MPWELSDAKLLSHCRLESFVSSGPGGQKRHKTNAAVRITHLPTKISAIETESRSHRENQIHALRDLRQKLAMELRRDVDPLTYEPPPWLNDYDALKVNEKNPLYPSLIAEIFDLLKATHYNLAPTASALRVSTSALSKFLHQNPHLWTKTNHLRSQLGLDPLKWNR
jgi:peptide chain release factor-like protein